MRIRATLTLFVVSALVGLVTVAPAGASVVMFTLHDHPNGDLNPPSYGLRLDDLIPSGEYTFSFDYSDGSGNASVVLAYDDVAGTVHISGRAFGGKDTGTSWDPANRGWINIDFTFTTNVSLSDDCSGGVGDDIYVKPSASNTGTVSLDGWGGNAVFNFSDKANTTGCSFVFDNDTDSKGNASLAGNPSIWSGSGWLMPDVSGSRDWLFIGEMQALSTHVSTWGQVKAMYK
jgi:hypothetical protein